MRLYVHRRVEAVDAVSDPVFGHAVRQLPEHEHVQHIRTHTRHNRDRAQRHLIDFAPGLVGGVTVVMTGDIELSDLKGLLFIDAHTALRQLHGSRRTDVNVQGVGEQFALNALFMLAAL